MRVWFSENERINKASIKLFRRAAGGVKGQLEGNDHADRMQSASNPADHRFPGNR